MVNIGKKCFFKVILIVILAPLHDTITVSPSLCPTNKIAPHRRVVSSGRTFAAYYDLLLVPNTPRPVADAQTQDPLQEQPQADQPDDCGEIEDYDENDLSSVTQRNQRRVGRTDNRFLFGSLFHRPQKLPAYTPPAQTPSREPISTTSRTPTRPERPIHFPQRPPYWSGGYFSQNQYNPQLNEYPSDNLKPVHEATDVLDVPQTYRPGLVGGPLGHVVGLSQAKPTPPTSDEKTRRRLEYLSSIRQRTTQPTFYTTARPRPRKLTYNDSVLGSFIDLFF